MIRVLSGQTVQFEYLNHRGELSLRTVLVTGIDYGSNEWYPEPQFFLRGIDQPRGVVRSFAFANITKETFRIVNAPTES